MRHELEIYYDMKSLRDRANAAKELYYRLKHKETLERLQEGAKICGPGEISEILSNKENQFVFQTEYKRFWEDTE